MIISYYTEDYRREAKSLVASLRHFNLDYDIHQIEDQGGWDKNTHYKPIFILEQLKKRDYVVWTDADSVIKKDPVLFKLLSCDIAFHRFKGTELLSGTVFFKNTPRTIKLLNTWIAVNEMSPELFDQVNLDTAISLVKDLKVDELPAEYCFIFDLSRELNPQMEPVISHYQASRTHRRYK